MRIRFSRTITASLEGRFGGASLFVVIFFTFSTATRLALCVFAARSLDLDFSLLAAFAWGAVFDLAAAGCWSLPLVLALALAPSDVFERRPARRVVYAGIVVLFAALLFVGVAEWLFWDEFGARFNFIAVDYLVYAREVVGNIRESYPMPRILGGIVLGAVVLAGAFQRGGWPVRWLDHASAPASARWRFAAAWIGVVAALTLALDERRLPVWKNDYHREIAKNGPWSFVAAFRSNQLDYNQFYPTLPIDAAFARVHAAQVRAGDAGQDLLRVVSAPVPAAPERRLNVIQITVESLSAEFLGRYGSTRGWTPRLDALAAKSLVFENIYATGTRTDRGMEALTLSVPPTPGRSLIKRPENAGLFTLGSVFRSKGYDTAFLYGGYGYFDNMNAFFAGNGYRVVDRARVAAADVTFANAWGACDEDLFRWSIREADRQHAAGTPFFQFLMTTSNHRPFTFPAGRIDLPSQTSRRAGGVKYTDFAIGRLLDEAATHPWFNQTVFVIVADHCASSAGRAELPVQNYHIPLIIYAPGGQIAPGVVKTLASQVDFAPTLLALLNWSYPSRFFGWDVTAPDAPPGRALVGTYQKLGLYDGHDLAVLAPVRQAHAFAYDPADNQLTALPGHPALIDDAIACYQTASWLFKHHRQGEVESRPASGPFHPVRGSVHQGPSRDLRAGKLDLSDTQPEGATAVKG